MKNSRRNSLLAALLVCLAPAAASAAEGYLTPYKNGGSGAMPSGYSKLYFEVIDGDWVGELKLPVNPRADDVVVLSSMATWGSRLDLAGTAMADQVYLPIETLTNVELRWNDQAKQWDVAGGLSARALQGSNVPTETIAVSDELMTQLVLSDGRHAGRVELPHSAPAGAQLVVSNRATWGTAISGTALAGGDSQVCASGSDCGYVFNADGKWHARNGREHYQPTTSQLPKPAARWTDVIARGPADDVFTPPQMTLPVQAVEGDIYRMADMSNSGFYSINGVTLTAKPLIYVYRAGQGTWVPQDTWMHQP